MANARNAAANAANVADAWRTDYKLENRRIKSIRLTTEKGKNARISFELDGEPFKSYDFKTGEKIETNVFSMDIANVGLQCGEVKEFKRANRYLLGANLTPIIVSSVLDNAIISVDRVFKAKGEKRENGNDVYTNDLFKTIITNVQVDMDDFALEDYKDAINALKEAANKSITAETTTTTTKFGLIW